MVIALWKYRKFFLAVIALLKVFFNLISGDNYLTEGVVEFALLKIKKFKLATQLPFMRLRIISWDQIPLFTKSNPFFSSPQTGTFFGKCFQPSFELCNFSNCEVIRWSISTAKWEGLSQSLNEKVYLSRQMKRSLNRWENSVLNSNKQSCPYFLFWTTF